LPGYFLEALAEQAAERVRHPEAIIDTSTHQLFGIKATIFSEFTKQHATVFSR